YERSADEFEPMAEILLQLVPLVETFGGIHLVRTALPELVKIAPKLARGRSYRESPRAQDVEAERMRLFETVTDFVVRASEIVPFALYVNDMQWAGMGPADLFTYIARRLGASTTARCALLGSYRSDEVQGRPLEGTVTVLRQHALSIDVELRPLCDDDV